ncbi:helix-turn-helix domain-containing protein [Streptomyces murinus]|uniref:helix-turn-helix domain-containing protein n=1 Tax=Streptomyces murinus TaxID=33900 RepID=UPI003F48AE58
MPEDEEITWPKHRYKLKPEDRQRAHDWLRKKYDGGASIRSIAREIKRSYGFVHMTLSDAGVTLRPRGGRPANPRETRP